MDGPKKQFVDRQVRGPYRLWHHTHRFEAVGDETVMEDEVRYALPLGPIGVCAHSLLVEHDLWTDLRFPVAANSGADGVVQLLELFSHLLPLPSRCKQGMI